MSRGSIVLFVVILAATILVANMIINEEPGPPGFEIVQKFNVHVLRTIDSYHYLMQDEDTKGKLGAKYHAHFCSSYEPQFDGGMILDILTYEDRGDCWDIRNTHPAYIIRHDSHHKIVREVHPDE